MTVRTIHAALAALLLVAAGAQAQQPAAPPPTPQQPAPPPAAAGAPPTNEQLFAGYIASDGYRDYLLNAFNKGEAPASRRQCAKPMQLLEWTQFSVLEPPTFKQVEGNWKVETGMWTVRAVLDRCGKKVIRRAMLRARPGTENLDGRLLIPGDFRANLRTEAEAIRIVMPQVASAGNCTDPKKVHVLDVAPIGEVKPQGWSETWTTEACGQAGTAKVSYALQNGSLIVSASDVKLNRAPAPKKP